MKTRLPILLWFSLLVIPGIAQQSASELLRHYRQILPLEKLYLHTDQSVYEPGDLVWFSALLVGPTTAKYTSKYHTTVLENNRPALRLRSATGRLFF